MSTPLTSCPLCSSAAASAAYSPNSSIVNCRNCGSYVVDEQAVALLTGPRPAHFDESAVQVLQAAVRAADVSHFAVLSGSVSDVSILLMSARGGSQHESAQPLMRIVLKRE